MKLLFSADAPPLHVIAAAEVASLPISFDGSLAPGSSPSLILPDGSKLVSSYVLLRYIGRAVCHLKLYGSDAYESGQIDQWLDYVPIFHQGSEFEAACDYVNNYLSTHTFLVGQDMSIADIALWSSLAGNDQRWESLRRSLKYINLVRWYNSLTDECSSCLNEVLVTYLWKRSSGKPENVKDVNSQNNPTSVNGASGKTMKTPNSASEFELPNAELGKVCLRFAPKPSGYLHIGHVKAALLNKYFVEKYKGKLIVRLDDTNPAKESQEFVDSLLKDIESLGIVYDTITYTSDHFPKLMEMAKKLIREGKAYVDDTPVDEMRTGRDQGAESKCRSNSVEKNLELWKEMIAGSDKGVKCCLRGELDFKNPNKCLRDPVYYRCNSIPHHRLGPHYKLYPTYDFASPFVDALEGITHALRSSEYCDRDAQYQWIQKDMGVRKVDIYEFSRLNMVYTLLSKRKLLWFVQNGKVDGWDDPRLPTFQGVLRRSLKIEALIQFILEQGASTNQNLMEWDKLWSINKRIVDPVCPRHTAVIEDRRVLVVLTNGPEEPFVRIVPRHKKCDSAGEKCTTYTKNIWIDYTDATCISVEEEVTFMDWGNAIIKEINRDAEGNVVQLVGVLHLEGSVKTTKLKLTWLPETDKLIKLQLVEFDYLITKKKLGNNKGKKTKDKSTQDEEFFDAVNPVTRQDTAAVGDANLRNLKYGEIVQLERKGYFRCDVPFVNKSKAVVLFGNGNNKGKKTKDKSTQDEEFFDAVNPVTRQDTAAVGDANLRNLKYGEIVQLERKGYFRCDVPFVNKSKAVVLFGIPDGRQRRQLVSSSMAL